MCTLLAYHTINQNKYANAYKFGLCNHKSVPYINDLAVCFITFKKKYIEINFLVGVCTYFDHILLYIS